MRLGVPVVTDASRVKLDDEGVEAAHMAYGGAAERVEHARGMAIVLVGSGVFEIDEAPAAGTVERAAASIEPGPIKLVGRQEKQEEVVDLGSAKVVVCVGRGIQNKQNLGKAQEVRGAHRRRDGLHAPHRRGRGLDGAQSLPGRFGCRREARRVHRPRPCRARCSTPWAWRNRSSWWPSTRTRTLRS